MTGNEGQIVNLDLQYRGLKWLDHISFKCHKTPGALELE